MSTEGWINKEDVRYTHTHTHITAEILHSQKKWNPAICDNTGWPWWYKWNTKWNQSDGER